MTAAPSLASDLSWLLFVASQPSMQARYPKLADIFKGREDLATRVRNFWTDGSAGASFAEMQVLAHHAGALVETDPDSLWAAIESAVATIPLDLEMPSESAEERAVYLERFRMLRSSPDLLRSYLDVLREVWAPVDDMWQQALPVIEEAGRLVVAQYERGQSLEILITPGCDILIERMPQIVADVEAGKPLLFVPCLFFGSSMYLEFADVVVIGNGRGPGRRRGAGADRIGGPAPQGRRRSHPSRPLALAGHRAELRGRAGACCSGWPSPPSACT